MPATTIGHALHGRVWEVVSSRGLQLFCGFLSVVGASEALRLIAQGESSEARFGGWYLLGVAALIASGALSRPRAGDGVDDQTALEAEAAIVDDPRRPPYVREAVIFFIVAFAYAWSLPWIGFALANGLFVAVYLLLIDRRRWFVALFVAAIVDVALVSGMEALNVTLPTGVIGLPF